MKERINYLGVLLLFLLISSCFSNDKEVSFQVINESNHKIFDITISNGVNNVFIAVLKNQESQKVRLKFEGVPKHDGGYYIKYNLDSKEYLKNFGYYDNGTPLSSNYILTIKKDTVIISERVE